MIQNRVSVNDPGEVLHDFARILKKLMSKDARLCPQLRVASTLSQKRVVKAEGAGHSGPMFKPDNAEYAFLARVPKGWDYFGPLPRCSPRIWAPKPHGSRLALGQNNRQRRSRSIEGTA